MAGWRNVCIRRASEHRTPTPEMGLITTDQRRKSLLPFLEPVRPTFPASRRRSPDVSRTSVRALHIVCWGSLAYRRRTPRPGLSNVHCPPLGGRKYGIVRGRWRWGKRKSTLRSDFGSNPGGSRLPYAGLPEHQPGRNVPPPQHVNGADDRPGPAQCHRVLSRPRHLPESANRRSMSRACSAGGRIERRSLRRGWRPG